MPTFPTPLTYPVQGAPTISGTTVTADFLLQDPRRVTRLIASLVLQRFYVDRIFSPAGDITGGSVVFDVADANYLYATRDVQRVEPGEEFPIITFERSAPKTAQVEKFGGKFDVTDEAVRRNRVGTINRSVQQLANTIQRKTQQRALLELTAAVTAYSRTSAGTSWSTAAGVAVGSQVATVGPLADVTNVVKQNDVAELGYSYDLAIMNPTDWRNFRLAAGGLESEARAILADSGINDVWTTNRKTAGTVYWLASGQVGELGYEVPLFTETWRDKDGKQKTWYQSSVNPIVYVTDPFAILETTGH
jgi:hypothetical protein